MPILFALVAVILALTFAISLMVAGYQGIEHHIGAIWAVAAIIIAFVFKFTIPLTIGAFFGAMHVWGWPWYLALLFVSPGLLVILPSSILLIYAFYKQKLS